MNPILVSYATFSLMASKGAGGTYVLRGDNGATGFLEFNGALYTATILESDFADFVANLQSHLVAASSVNDAMALAAFLPQARIENQGAPLVSITARRGSETIRATHNFCDRSTWYTESVRVTDEVLVDNGDGLTFTSAHTYWIDLTHGRLWNEDNIALRETHGYAVIVLVDGVTLTERVPFETTGGDYTVDYAAGSIAFAVSQAGKSVVCSYSYENGSKWILAPLPGRSLLVESAKVTWTDDVVLNDDIRSDTYAYNPADLPNKVLVSHSRYKTIQNIMVEAEIHYPAVPGAAGPRGAPGTRSAQFRYGTATELSSLYGVETHISLDNDRVCGGTRASVTFYCTSALLT